MCNGPPPKQSPTNSCGSKAPRQKSIEEGFPCAIRLGVEG